MKVAVKEIVANTLEATVWEMCRTLIRTAYSPNIKERADCSTAICDLGGRTLALATHGPAHLGSALRLSEAILQRFPRETILPGDVFLANDPYIVGVTHLNDLTVATPVFIDGELVAFIASMAHHSDVGGRVPGSEAGDSDSIFQEGLRIPPVRLVEAGARRGDVWELVTLNSRTPHFMSGDLNAQIAANARGAQRLAELFDRYGSATVLASVEEILDATERRTRAQIGEVLRPGTYEAEDWIDEDGINDDPIRLQVRVTVAADSVLFDFSGCGPQLPTSKNMPLTQTMATVFYALKTMVDPGVPINEGLFRAVRVVAPEGSIVNCTAPAGVSARNLSSMILADSLLDALGQAAPSRAVASSGPLQGIILAGPDPHRKVYFVDYENFAGGLGASSDRDGMNTVQVHMSNTSNLPIEVMELEFPVRVEAYEIVCDSGGPGKFRGGCGVRRDLRILVPDTVVATRSKRQHIAARGRDGGRPGSLGRFILNPDTPAESRLRSTSSNVPLRQGDLLRIITPGGGGFGDPADRDPVAVCKDLREGKISSRAAREEYSASPHSAGCSHDDGIAGENPTLAEYAR